MPTLQDLLGILCGIVGGNIEKTLTVIQFFSQEHKPVYNITHSMAIQRLFYTCIILDALRQLTKTLKLILENRHANAGVDILGLKRLYTRLVLRMQKFLKKNIFEETQLCKVLLKCVFPDNETMTFRCKQINNQWRGKTNHNQKYRSKSFKNSCL